MPGDSSAGESPIPRVSSQYRRIATASPSWWGGVATGVLERAQPGSEE